MATTFAQIPQDLYGKEGFHEDYKDAQWHGLTDDQSKDLMGIFSGGVSKKQPDNIDDQKYFAFEADEEFTPFVNDVDPSIWKFAIDNTMAVMCSYKSGSGKNVETGDPLDRPGGLIPCDSIIPSGGMLDTLKREQIPLLDMVKCFSDEDECVVAIPRNGSMQFYRVQFSHVSRGIDGFYAGKIDPQQAGNVYHYFHTQEESPSRPSKMRSF